MFRRKVLPGNGQPVTTWVYGADIHAQRIASLGVYTNTFSPGNYGLHGPHDAARTGYTGDPGYGVNRFGGDIPPLQNWYSLVAPLTHPKNKRLGAGAGVSGQPGLPSTGDTNNPGLGFGIDPNVAGSWGA